MARDYAQIFTAIWKDADFRALDSGAQRVYLLLVTQPDISAAGTLGLTINRWSRFAEDTTRSGIEKDLYALEESGFICFDEETEELLVRTFIKHDRGYGNSKRRGAIIDTARLVNSAKLRAALWSEFAKLGIENHLPSRDEFVGREIKNHGSLAGVSAGDSVCDALSHAVPHAVSHRACDAVPHTVSPNERLGFEAASHELEPRSSKAKTPRSSAFGGDPVTAVDNELRARDARTHASARASAQARDRAGARAYRSKPDDVPPSDVEPGPAEAILIEWRGRLRRPEGSTVSKVGLFVHGALAEGHDPDDIRETLRRWDALDRKGPGLLPSLLHEVANAPRPGTGLAQAGPPRQRSSKGKAFDRAAELAAAIRAEEGSKDVAI